MNDSPMMAYFGHHKCGSVSICAIVEAVCAKCGLTVARHANPSEFGDDIRQFRAAHPFDFWCFTNADIHVVAQTQVHGFHVVRDPRDVVVSGYFSHRNSHPTSAWPKLIEFRERLRSVTKEEGLLLEMDFVSDLFEQMLQWQEIPGVREVKFEELIRSPAEMFIELLSPLMPASELMIRQVVDEYSFVNLSGGRRPGEEDVNHHFRKGVPGDWRNHFTPAHLDRFKALYNPLLVKLGYETDDSWAAVAPERLR